ncbi:hypothetical protein FHX35_000722 [Auritidibacter ignavus]|nr:hypothetical protein [Auritidibacter ignavus]
METARDADRYWIQQVGFYLYYGVLEPDIVHNIG